MSYCKFLWEIDFYEESKSKFVKKKKKISSACCYNFFKITIGISIFQVGRFNYSGNIYYL